MRRPFSVDILKFLQSFHRAIYGSAECGSVMVVIQLVHMASHGASFCFGYNGLLACPPTASLAVTVQCWKSPKREGDPIGESIDRLGFHLS